MEYQNLKQLRLLLYFYGVFISSENLRLLFPAFSFVVLTHLKVSIAQSSGSKGKTVFVS